MLKTEIKAKWLHELRHGGHEQVCFTLKGLKPDGTAGYCCLGVLEEKVLGNELEAIVLDTEAEGDLGYEGPKGVYEGPKGVYDYIKTIVIGDEHLVNDYMTRNDDDGWTFPEIADYIERTWNPDVDETVE